MADSFSVINKAIAGAGSFTVDAYTEEAPIIADMPMYETTDGIKHVYEYQAEVTGAAIVEFDEARGTISSETELRQVTLDAIGGKMEIGEDTAIQYPGGIDAYYAKRIPPILKKTSADLETSVYYNSFLAYAAANSNLIDAGGSGSTNYSFVCVHYADEEIGGLYDPTSYSADGQFFRLEDISGGNRYLDANGRMVYGKTLNTYFGMLLANPRYVSAIVNSDKASDAPSGTRTFATEMMLDDMILKARGGSANTVIYCHPAALNYLNQYKSTALNMRPEDSAFNRQIASWNGVPIVTSYNIKNGTESTVSVPGSVVASV